MAIVAFQTPISGVRGKVGGQIFSANGSGPYVKAWAKGSNPRSEAQTDHRANLVQFSQSWAILSQTDRDDWDVYAADVAQDKINSLGETYSASGFAWFVQINLARLQAGQSQLDPAPTLAIPGTPLPNVMRFDTSDSALETTINLLSGSPDLTFQHVVRAQVVISLGRQVFANIRPYMITVVPNAFRNVPFQDEVETHFGTISLKQKLFATIVIQNADGRQGTFASLSAESETN